MFFTLLFEIVLSYFNCLLPFGILDVDKEGFAEEQEFEDVKDNGAVFVKTSDYFRDWLDILLNQARRFFEKPTEEKVPFAQDFSKPAPDSFMGWVSEIISGVKGFERLITWTFKDDGILDFGIKKKAGIVASDIQDKILSKIYAEWGLDYSKVKDGLLRTTTFNFKRGVMSYSNHLFQCMWFCLILFRTSETLGLPMSYLISILGGLAIDLVINLSKNPISLKSHRDFGLSTFLANTGELGLFAKVKMPLIRKIPYLFFITLCLLETCVMNFSLYPIVMMFLSLKDGYVPIYIPKGTNLLHFGKTLKFISGGTVEAIEHKVVNLTPLEHEIIDGLLH